MADLVFVFGTDVYYIPYYKGHAANFQYSEDKQYIGFIVSPNKNEWNHIMILVRASDYEILGFNQISKDTLDISSVWFPYCYDDARFKQRCFEPADSKDAISLPPSLWTRLNAWLIVKIRGFKVPTLSKKEWSRY